jgi:hypothetical protein
MCEQTQIIDKKADDGIWMDVAPIYVQGQNLLLSVLNLWILQLESSLVFKFLKALVLLLVF